MANANTNQQNGIKNFNMAAYNRNQSDPKGDAVKTNWGADAIRSAENVFGNLSRIPEESDRNLLTSRLWHGVPQLTEEQMQMFEAAYTGHTFIFCVNMPRFMMEGIYANTEMHRLVKNFKAVVERASTGFSGFSPIQVNTANVEDGNGRKISHVTSVEKDQSNISLRLHEFGGLPVKNFLEAWVTGIYDIRSQHGNYHGNLGIDHGWCLKNHSMSILVVQVTPDWTTIQDAAYYFNMVPTEIPFQHFEWTKGEATIVDDYDIDFVCNEERSPAIMLAAEKYMNNRVLSMVSTSVYNSRQFVAADFGMEKLASSGFYSNLGKDKNNNSIIDNLQYNKYIPTTETIKTGDKNNSESLTAVGRYGKDDIDDLKIESYNYDNDTKSEEKNNTNA